MNKAIAIISILIGVGIVGWLFLPKSPDALVSPSVSIVPAGPVAHINGKDINLLIADTEATQELGLGNHDGLPEDTAMLFVFTKPDIYEFWMKDMKFPIDIIWLDPNYKIVHIESDVATSTYPGTTFKPDTESLFVLETNAHFAQNNNLKIGDTVEIDLKK